MTLLILYFNFNHKVVVDSLWQRGQPTTNWLSKLTGSTVLGTSLVHHSVWVAEGWAICLWYFRGVFSCFLMNKELFTYSFIYTELWIFHWAFRLFIFMKGHHLPGRLALARIFCLPSGCILLLHLCECAVSLSLVTHPNSSITSGPAALPSCIFLSLCWVRTDLETSRLKQQFMPKYTNSSYLTH